MTDFLKMRNQTAAERLAQVRSAFRPDTGMHRKTKLSQAGCGSSGSLLHAAVSTDHAMRLNDDFASRFGGNPSRRGTLYLLTILHAVTLMDKLSALSMARELEGTLRQAIDGTGVVCLGAIEVEVVNLAMLRTARSSKDDAIRKLNVLELLASDGLDTGLLIHFHGIIDLGNSLLQELELRERIASMAPWRRAPFQVQLKGFFRTQSLEDSLRHISAYITKGGNDRLEYHLGFGRMPNYELDAQIWRSGTGRADRGGDTITNERSLTVTELAVLDQIWIGLMVRRSDNRGYLIDIH